MGRMNNQASMGPRFLGRGNINQEINLSVGVAASMGPRFLGRGNSSLLTMREMLSKLQWGRAF